MQTANQPAIQNAGQAPAASAGTVSQVAWQFVVQYYTYVNSKPDQLHRFYTKTSHYLHGVEGEETSVLQGQAAIHKKFVDIGFKNCKVFIHSVDAHPSANNGILVHVIGEMSNNGEPWKKFVQAFFLAEQQNGYFVMNDNFRYLKEETFGEEDEEGAEGQESGDYTGGQGQDQTAPSIPEQTQPSYGSIQTNGYHTDQSYAAPNLISHQPAPVPVEAPVPIAAVPIPVEPVVEETPAPVPEPAPVAVPEVVEPVKPQQPATPPAKLATPAPPSPAAAYRKTPSPVPPTAAPASEPSTGQPSYTAPAPAPPASVSAPSTAPSSQPQPPSATPAAAAPATPPQPAQPPQPAAPPAPKTWAGMAAANSARWGHNVAQEAKGVSASVPQQQQSHTAPAAQPPRERPAGGPTGGAAAGASAGGDPALQPGGVGPKNIPSNQQHPLYAQALTVTTPLCFIKGVTENIPQQALEQVLSSRFGPIKECEVVRSKACAFLEFRSVDSAKRAIIASLHPNNGGDGGVKLDEEKYGSPARVIVETRKERGDRPAPRARGTPIPAGEGRGAGDKGPGGPGQQGQGNYRGGGRGGNVRGRGDGGRGGGKA